MLARLVLFEDRRGNLAHSSKEYEAGATVPPCLREAIGIVEQSRRQESGSTGSPVQLPQPAN